MLFFSHTDHHFVPYSKHCDVHLENMAERNWICPSLWCPHAENLEVRERLLWHTVMVVRDASTSSILTSRLMRASFFEGFTTK